MLTTTYPNDYDEDEYDDEYWDDYYESQEGWYTAMEIIDANS